MPPDGFPGQGQFVMLLGDWPLEQKRVAPRISQLMNSPGTARHDMILEKNRVGRVIGPQGSTLKVGPRRSSDESSLAN